MPERSPWKPNRPLFIGLAGGSGSGKTTIAEDVVDRLEGRVALLHHDAYYRHRVDLTFEERTRLNYDHPASLETELLIEHLERLRSGLAVELPVYDFAEHLRSEETVRIAPARVVVIEGILVLSDARLRSELDLKIFVDTDPDLRLARRLERDITERGRSVDSVIDQYFATVRPMHLEFVEPSRRYADLIIPEGFNPAAVATVVELIRSRLN
ncbi:MAG TPA: uridine kinase [Acidimicrobiia bacterium]|nr:uridine kinase [Acidimicrobiia bacterium]